jgi:hypothetical protein
MSLVANNGNMTISFAEEGINTNGTKTRAMRLPSPRTDKRINAEATIISLAKQSGQPAGKIVSKVVAGSVPELREYVQGQGEVPADSPTTLAVQAALLRALEVATVAKAVDTTDADAMEIIESAENDAVQDNTPESSKILPPDAQAAISLLLYRIADRHRKRGGSGLITDFVNDLRKSKKADGFDFGCGEVADNATGGGGIVYMPEQEDNPYTTTTGTDSGGNSFWDDLFGTIDKVVDGIGKVTTAVGGTVDKVSTTSGGILDKVKNIGSDVGADSIGKYMAENWWKILLGIIAAVLLIILIARAAKR